MPRLFISHSGRDNVEALAFQSWLVANGWAKDDVFIDLHSIGAGERWRETLRKANRSCEAVVLLASPEALKSIECQKEIDLAEALGKEIILAILRDLTKEDPLLARYSERQMVDLSAFPQDHIEALEWEGRSYRIGFNPLALAAIKRRLEELGIAPGSFAWPPKDRPNAEPYPGLAAFGEDDAGIFFGRDADIMTALTEIRLVRRRRAPRLIVIDAASGAGKSSFLRAGLWPRLKRDPEFEPLAILRPAQGILRGPDGLGRRLAPWFEERGRTKTPGAIHAAVGKEDPAAAAGALAEVLSEAAGLAAEARRVVAPEAGAPALIIAIDQAEELFAAENEAESRTLLAALAAVLRAPPEGVDPYVLVAIRADSVQSLLVRVAELGLEAPKPLYLPPLSTAAYREVVLRPAEVYSERVRALAVEPDLVQALVEDATGADALPLLAFTLGQLFNDFRAEGKLTLAQYRAGEGVGGSIRRALRDAQLRAGAAGSEENLRRLIVPRLATWDPEADQHAGAAKRLVANLSDLLTGERAGLAPLVSALVEVRLLSRGRDTVEVAHEALLRQPPISDWLAEDREFLVWRDRLGRARAEFDANARGLLVGRELQLARAWLQTRAADLAPADRAFIEASAAEDDRQRGEAEAKERALQAAELARRTAELEASRRAQRLTVRWLVASSVFAVMALALGALALLARNQAGAEAERATAERNRAVEAIKAREAARARYLASSADQAGKDGDTATALLLTMETVPDAKGDDAATKDRPMPDGAARNLDAVLRNLREHAILKGHTGLVRSVAMSPDGKWIVTGAWGDAPVRIWDAETGAELRRLEGHTGDVNSVAVSSDGKRIVTGSDDRTARIWDAETGAELRRLKGHTGYILAVAISPDETRIVTGSGDNTARVWNARTGEELVRITGHTNDVKAVAVTPDGSRIVTASADNTARIWDATNGAELSLLKGHMNDVNSIDVATTGDGVRIVTGSNDRTARVWDLKGKELQQLKGHTGDVNSVAFSDGSVVTASNDGTVRIWDIDGTERFRLTGHTGSVRGMAVSQDGSRIVTGSDDRTARIWDARSETGSVQLKGHGSYVWAVAATPDGTRIVTGSRDDTARVWDAKTGAELLLLKGHTNDVRGVAVTPDGGRIVTASADDTARIWNAADGAPLLHLKGHTGTVYGVAVTPDGTRVVTGSADHTARIWDASTGVELRQLRGHTNEINAVAVSRDGRRVVTGSDDGTARIWDTGTGAELLQLKGHIGGIFGVAVTPDGARVVTTGGDRTVRIWDARTGGELLQLKGHKGAVLGVAVWPDGSRIATGSGDGTVRIWDAGTGAELARLDARRAYGANGVAITPDGSRVIAGFENRVAYVWELLASVQSQLDLAKARVPRCLAPNERQRHDLAPPPPWCREKWPYDAVSAPLVGGRMLTTGAHDDANSLFAAARTLAVNADAAKRVDEAWAEALLAQGRTLVRDGRRDEAKVLLDEARIRNPAAGKRADEVWAVVFLERGGDRVRDGQYKEADELFEEARKLDPATDGRINGVWVDALLSRGSTLLRGDKEKEAESVFAQALSRDPGSSKRVESVRVDAMLERGSDLLRRNQKDDAATRKAKQQDALALFEDALRRSREASLDTEQVGRAVFGRGSAREFLERYVEAIDDFREAARLGHTDADARRWWATDGLALQARNEGKAVSALLMAATNYLDITPAVRQQIGLRSLKDFMASVTIPIAMLHGDALKPSWRATDCDLSATHPYDPYRVASGKGFDDIDAPKAVQACDLELKSHPNEMRYRFQRGRSLSRAARLALAEGDKAKGDKLDADAIAELKLAAEGGYPIAFNNLGFAYRQGEGLDKDEDKAADLYLETFNRVVHCCWTPVARYLLEHEGEHDRSQVRRLVHDLTRWASALGSEPASRLLRELYAGGTLTAPASPLAEEKATFASLPPWLGQPLDVRSTR